MWSDKIWLTVETSSFCNYRCPDCSQHNLKLKNKCFIDNDFWYKIIDSFVENRFHISNLNPFFRGEPLIHPDFGKLLLYTRKKAAEFLFCDFMTIHTNAYYLEEKNSYSLLEISDQKVFPHPNDVFLSLDASNSDVYSKIRIGGDFERVKTNIINFLTLRKKRNQFGPNLIFQFIVRDENVNYICDFYYFWSEVLKKYSHKSFEVHFSENNNPWKVKTDTIYFRMLETSSNRKDFNMEIFNIGLKKLKEKGIIQNSELKKKQ